MGGSHPEYLDQLVRWSSVRVGLACGWDVPKDQHSLLPLAWEGLEPFVAFCPRERGLGWSDSFQLHAQSEEGTNIRYQIARPKGVGRY